MVKVRDATKYECEVCRKSYWREYEAQKCETKSPMRIELSFNHMTGQEDWNIGDFLILYPSERNMCMLTRVPVLAKAIGETQISHDIVPVLEFLSTRAFRYPGAEPSGYKKACWGKVIKFNDDIKEMLVEWLDGLNDGQDS